MLTEKISMTLASMARGDINARVPFYHSSNQGSQLHARLVKQIAMPAPVLRTDPKYLRMMYTAQRYFIEVKGDR